MTLNRREQKKRATFAAIVDAAERSFDGIGYDATSMETIAQVADVSAGTVYNYFGTKGAILAAIVTRHVEEAMVEADKRLDLGTDDPVDALMPMISIYLDQMTGYGPTLLKELLRAGFDPAQTDLLVEFVSGDERVILQLSEALDRMRARGLLSLVVDANGAALLVYSIVVVALMMFVSIPGTTPDDVRESCRSQLEIAFDGLAATRHGS
jgi:AcrR family transcriptional regulator